MEVLSLFLNIVLFGSIGFANIARASDSSPYLPKSWQFGKLVAYLKSLAIIATPFHIGGMWLFGCWLGLLSSFLVRWHQEPSSLLSHAWASFIIVDNFWLAFFHIPQKAPVEVLSSWLTRQPDWRSYLPAWPLSIVVSDVHILKLGGNGATVIEWAVLNTPPDLLHPHAGLLYKFKASQISSYWRPSLGGHEVFLKSRASPSDCLLSFYPSSFRYNLASTYPPVLSPISFGPRVLLNVTTYGTYTNVKCLIAWLADAKEGYPEVYILLVYGSTLLPLLPLPASRFLAQKGTSPSIGTNSSIVDSIRSAIIVCQNDVFSLAMCGNDVEETRLKVVGSILVRMYFLHREEYFLHSSFGYQFLRCLKLGRGRRMELEE
ncbi:hypothetical protein FNV43_RR01612 [Rhamnella rubrinervis]|uniref:Uncharacterized protein n=1 Tax=Rhamnella rubrinervis TaxID=2594499 RepID=A0A8K0HQ56_9ROSA|nr:hypothetical protein FNV43_RR01612 [Rhamnella rubrinervis]